MPTNSFMILDCGAGLCRISRSPDLDARVSAASPPVPGRPIDVPEAGVPTARHGAVARQMITGERQADLGPDVRNEPATRR